MTLRLVNTTFDNENLLYESIITEAIEIHGCEFLYIPRTFISKDELLGEDRLSKFKNAYPVIMYLENAEGFEGQGAFLSKFGIQMEQQATLTVARKTWQTVVGNAGQTILPDRPAEGDLLYFPMTGGLFEIMFVQHQSPFYQLGQLYVYKLTVELFRYSSETMETGNTTVDAFNDLKTTGAAAVETPKSFGDNSALKQKAAEYVFDNNNPFGDIL